MKLLRVGVTDFYFDIPPARRVVYQTYLTRRGSAFTLDPLRSGIVRVQTFPSTSAVIAGPVPARPARSAPLPNSAISFDGTLANCDAQPAYPRCERRTMLKSTC